jgi:putative nucleotidyltransferase with HDIG domain
VIDSSTIDSQSLPTDTLELEGPDALLLDMVLSDLDADRITVPLFPPTARRILAIARGAVADAKSLTLLFSTDPTLAALILRQTHAQSVPAAVEEAGTETVRRMLTTQAIKHVRTLRSEWARRKIAAAYHHSLEVAAYSSVLGDKLQGFDADKAMLCGLLHDIGLFPVVAAADDQLGSAEDNQTLDGVARRLHDLVGSMLLSRWGLDVDLVNAAEESGYWRRDPGPKPDYTDLVQVARLHAFIGTPRASGLPSIENIPSFRKIAGSPPMPRFGVALIRAGKHRLSKIEASLAQIGSTPEQT